MRKRKAGAQLKGLSTHFLGGLTAWRLRGGALVHGGGGAVGLTPSTRPLPELDGGRHQLEVAGLCGLRGQAGHSPGETWTLRHPGLHSPSRPCGLSTLPEAQALLECTVLGPEGYSASGLLSE